MRKFLFALFILFWLSVVSAGMALVWSYNHRPGQSAVAPKQWPSDSSIKRKQGYTLLLLAHPKCPCTRATMEELAKLLTNTGGGVETFILFVRPKGVPNDWTQTDLWQKAGTMPGVIVLDDNEGTEATRFGAHVSGQALLYNPRGELVFQGGLTESRGQVGDNTGRQAVEDLINQGRSDRAQTDVFGCPLFNETECPVPDHATNR